MAIWAFLVGVSNYWPKNYNLPFCRNDIIAMRRALESGLRVRPENIVSLGEAGTVNAKLFSDELVDLGSRVAEDDIFMLYFSGHGGSGQACYYLQFSDTIVSAQDIICSLERIRAKTKIIVLDCCMAGDFSLDRSVSLDIHHAVEELVGKGYAVLASSKADQLSWGHPGKEMSLFTAFLCDALEDKHIVRHGKKSLNDICRLVSLYLDLWNKRNPDRQQHPVFRRSMVGTVYFDVEEYTHYCRNRIFEETERYIIYDVEPTNSSSAKRYSAKVILKEPFSISEIGDISTDIKNRLLYEEVHKNEISERRWRGKPANIIWIYYGRDEEDMIHGHFLCRVTWVDEQQDKTWWYRCYQHDFVDKGLHFTLYPYYETLRNLRNNHAVPAEVFAAQSRDIIAELISLAEEAISIYNQFQNEDISEGELFDKMDSLIPKIEEVYTREGELGYAPPELHELQTCCSGLAAAVHSFTLYYNKRYSEQTSYRYRRECMNMAVQDYYVWLERVKLLRS